MKTFTLVAVTLSLLTAALTLGPRHPTEPSYRNKNLTAWLDELDTLDWDQWSRAAEAVQAMGTNALPTLSKLLRAKDSDPTRTLIQWTELYPVVLLRSAESRYETALEACRILGPAAGPLASDIVPFLADNHRAKAVKVLAAMGDDAIASLEKALSGADESARAGVAVALGTIARSPRSVVSALTERLRDRNAETRMSAAWALGRFGVSAQGAVPTLSRLTNDSASNVREQASLALSRIARSAGQLANASEGR